MNKIIYDIQNNRVAGFTSDPDFIETTRFVLAKPDTDWSEDLRDYSKLSNGVVSVDLEKYLSLRVKEVQAKVKETATNQISVLSWRLERAEERNKIGAEGESVSDVMREREAIRRASNRAEAELEALTTVEEIEAFTWEVLPEDYPPVNTMTRLQFMRRFTDAERQAIRAARDSGENQDLLDFWELMQLATDVRLSDGDIQMGVYMLETNGLIGEGRAEEVLTV